MTLFGLGANDLIWLAFGLLIAGLVLTGIVMTRPPKDTDHYRDENW